MVRTETTFKTSSKVLQHIYDSALAVLLASVKPFGDRRLLTTAPDVDTATLHYSVLCTDTISRYDLAAAFDTVCAFMATVRKDGRSASSIECKHGTVVPKYDALAGLCFAEEALNLYYLSRKSDREYLEWMLKSLLNFDEYLWKCHDLDFNQCLELFSESETEEGEGSNRYAPVRMELHGEMKDVSPFPVESYDLMACNFSMRNTIARIYALMGDQASAEEWTKKAQDVRSYLNTKMWSETTEACFDRDFRGNPMEAVSVGNLFAMYYGALDGERVDRFFARYMSARDGFGTSMPLPTLSRGDRHFSNDKGSNFNGQPRGSTYLRAIYALERYGRFSMLTGIGDKLLSTVETQDIFSEQFDPFTGEPSGNPAYAPTAAAILEVITRFFGVRSLHDHMMWGALGHGENYASSYEFTWGSDTFRLSCESVTSSAYMNEKRLFTVSNGVRVVTDIYGNDPKVINVTDAPLDCVFVYRDRTFSFTLEPDGVWKIT